MTNYYIGPQTPIPTYDEATGDLTISGSYIGDGSQLTGIASASGGGVLESYVVASGASAKIKSFATSLSGAGYPVWVCDGINDQVELLTADTAGGLVHLIGPTFYVSSMTLTGSCFRGGNNTSIYTSGGITVNPSAGWDINAKGNLQNITVRATTGFTGTALLVGGTDCTAWGLRGLLENVSVIANPAVTAAGLKINLANSAADSLIALCSFGDIYIEGFSAPFHILVTESGGYNCYFNGNKLSSIVINGGTTQQAYFQAVSGGEITENTFVDFQTQAQSSPQTVKGITFSGNGADKQIKRNVFNHIVFWDWSLASDQQISGSGAQGNYFLGGLNLVKATLCDSDDSTMTDNYIETTYTGDRYEGDWRPTLTIASGIVTLPACQKVGSFKVDTEAGAASDNLDKIQGGGNGDLLVLTCATGTHAVTVKTGTDNIYCGSDFVLDAANHTITLMKQGNSWIKISSADNA